MFTLILLTFFLHASFFRACGSHAPEIWAVSARGSDLYAFSVGSPFVLASAVCILLLAFPVFNSLLIRPELQILTLIQSQRCSRRP
jgi:hypothetical protein